MAGGGGVSGAAGLAAEKNAAKDNRVERTTSAISTQLGSKRADFTIVSAKRVVEFTIRIDEHEYKLDCYQWQNPES